MCVHACACMCVSSCTPINRLQSSLCIVVLSHKASSRCFLALLGRHRHSYESAALQALASMAGAVLKVLAFLGRCRRSLSTEAGLPCPHQIV